VLSGANSPEVKPRLTSAARIMSPVAAVEWLSVVSQWRTQAITYIRNGPFASVGLIDKYFPFVYN